MYRSSTGGGSGGRASLDGGRGQQLGETIQEVGRTLVAEMEQLAKRTQENAEGLDAKDVSNWKEGLIGIADSYARLQFDLQQARSILNDPNFDSTFQDVMTDDGSSDISAAHNKLNEIINSKAATFDANSNPAKDKLNVIFNIKRSGKREASDEIEVVESEAREADFTCPYTGKVFETPMKK